MKTLIIEKKYNEKKLNIVLKKEFPFLSENSIYKALRKKDIRVNDVKINSNVILHSGDKLKIFIPDDQFNLISYKKNNNIIEIIYEDTNIVILNKPINIEVTGNNSLTTLLSNIYNTNIYPCHRLDRNTVGLIIFAKNIKTQEELFNKFKNHEIQKKYIARIYGIPKENHKILRGFLFKDRLRSIVYISDYKKKGYQNIITEYTVLNTNHKDNTSILEIILHTGKTHQIRAHLAHIGLPIIGDSKYGQNSINKQFKSKTQNLCSYKILFNFTSDSGHLNYLNKKEFVLNTIPEILKY